MLLSLKWWSEVTLTLPVLHQCLVSGNVVLMEYFLIIFSFITIFVNIVGAKLSFLFP